MKIYTIVSIAIIAFVVGLKVSFSQTLELGALSTFIAYTGFGNVTNSGNVVT